MEESFYLYITCINLILANIKNNAKKQENQSIIWETFTVAAMMVQIFFNKPNFIPIHPRKLIKLFEPVLKLFKLGTSFLVSLIIIAPWFNHEIVSTSTPAAPLPAQTRKMANMYEIFPQQRETYARLS